MKNDELYKEILQRPIRDQIKEPKLKYTDRLSQNGQTETGKKLHHLQIRYSSKS